MNEIRVGSLVYLSLFDQDGIVARIRIDSNGEPLIDVTLDGLPNNIVCRFREVGLVVH